LFNVKRIILPSSKEKMLMINGSPQKSANYSQYLAQAILRKMSWELDVTLPANPKYVVVGAPHTSNMDFIYMLLLMFATGIKLRWIGKHTLFKSPLGSLMRKLGGIPVDRRKKNKFVEKIIDEINQHDEFVVAIAPEGTRSKSKYWRTGFYYIALGAGVPIVLGFIDYKDNVVGFGPSLYPSGDIQADFIQIKDFYASKTGKYPHLQGPLELRPKETQDTN
jgi:1-acyl-sn-glycerol-3-phosphate acyltransferase